MKIRRYRMEQLEEARRLQKECLKQHMPCPPVAWWRGQIIDENGKVKEVIESKCNSYTRNGLNLIASHALYLNPNIRSNTVFGDGVISYKDVSGVMRNSLFWQGVNIAYNISPTIVLGTGVGPENVDVINLTVWDTEIGMISTNFDAVSRKLQNSIGASFLNDSPDSVEITESGILVGLLNVGASGGASDFLVVRDLFEEPITIPMGKVFVFNYNFELFYP